jgi:hypothetical protein
MNVQEESESPREVIATARSYCQLREFGRVSLF